MLLLRRGPPHYAGALSGGSGDHVEERPGLHALRRRGRYFCARRSPEGPLLNRAVTGLSAPAFWSVAQRPASARSHANSLSDAGRRGGLLDDASRRLTGPTWLPLGAASTCGGP